MQTDLRRFCSFVGSKSVQAGAKGGHRWEDIHRYREEVGAQTRWSSGRRSGELLLTEVIDAVRVDWIWCRTISAGERK